MLVRGLVLPEENAPPQISVTGDRAAGNGARDLPSLISIRVALDRQATAHDRAA